MCVGEQCLNSQFHINQFKYGLGALFRNGTLLATNSLQMPTLRTLHNGYKILEHTMQKDNQKALKKKKTGTTDSAETRHSQSQDDFVFSFFLIYDAGGTNLLPISTSLTFQL